MLYKHPRLHSSVAAVAVTPTSRAAQKNRCRKKFKFCDEKVMQ